MAAKINFLVGFFSSFKFNFKKYIFLSQKITHFCQQSVRATTENCKIKKNCVRKKITKIRENQNIESVTRGFAKKITLN
jgi:hypothetical protein